MLLRLPQRFPSRFLLLWTGEQLLPTEHLSGYKQPPFIPPWWLSHKCMMGKFMRPLLRNLSFVVVVGTKDEDVGHARAHAHAVVWAEPCGLGGKVDSESHTERHDKSRDTQRHKTTHNHTQRHTQSHATTHSSTQLHKTTHNLTQSHITSRSYTQAHTATHNLKQPHTATHNITQSDTATHNLTQLHLTTFDTTTTQRQWCESLLLAANDAS